MVHAVDPAIAAYCPTLHASHAVTFDAAENLPWAHSVHVLAPALAPALVIDPAAQTVHAATLDTAEYWPAVHAVQLTAADAMPVLVMDPGWHTTQCDHLCAA